MTDNIESLQDEEKINTEVREQRVILTPVTEQLRVSPKWGVQVAAAASGRGHGGDGQTEGT